MGHAIDYYTFDFGTSKGIIFSECNDIAKSEGDSGLYGNIEFKDHLTPFESYDKAQAYIKSIDKSYGQFAVPYFEYPLPTPTAKLDELHKKCNELHNEYYNREKRQYYTKDTVKSQYLGCKKCGSRLAVSYLRGNSCPLCYAELRPETELNKIQALKEKYEKAFNAYVTARDNESHKNKPSKKWLVKIEYHC